MTRHDYDKINNHRHHWSSLPASPLTSSQIITCRSHGIPSVGGGGGAEDLGCAGVRLLGGKVHKGVTGVQVPHVKHQHLGVIQQVAAQPRVIRYVSLPFPPEE